MFRKTVTRGILASANFKLGATLVRQKSDKNLVDAAKIKKSVYISQSTDVHTNLALEDWIYKNMDFEHHHVMMLWRNDPCVVIGRHQNPWMEANVSALDDLGVRLARRNSGGGTVYHDQGNLNLTFFTSRDYYNRKYNLEIISRALFREWAVKSDISKREDIVIRNNYKVSGTAAKLGRKSAYHHCTLLVDVNKTTLHKALMKKDLGIATNATQSVPSPVLNLRDENHQVNVKQLITAVGWEYLRTPAGQVSDAGLNHASHQNGFKHINPTEGWFPDITKIDQELRSKEWIYGKTPKFSSTLDLPLITNKQDHQLKLSMQVEEGKIDDVTLNIPPGLSTLGFHGDAFVKSDLKGNWFSEAAVDSLRQLIPENCTKEKKDASAGLVKVESVI